MHTMNNYQYMHGSPSRNLPKKDQIKIARRNVINNIYIYIYIRMYIEKYLYCIYDLDYDYHIYRKHSNIKFFISLAIILVQGLHIAVKC